MMSDHPNHGNGNFIKEKNCLKISESQINEILLNLKNKSQTFEQIKQTLTSLFNAFLFPKSNSKPIKRLKSTNELNKFFEIIEIVSKNYNDDHIIWEIFKTIDKRCLITLINYLFKSKSSNNGLFILCKSMLINPISNIDYVYRILINDLSYIFKPSILKLLCSDQSIIQPFIIFIVTELKFDNDPNNEFSNTDEKVKIILELINYDPIHFDNEMIYYMISVLEEPIIDNFENDIKCQKSIMDLILKLDNLIKFEKNGNEKIENINDNDLILLSKVDKLLQFAIFNQSITIDDYLSNLFHKQNSEFIINSFFSLENLIFYEIDNTTYSTIFENYPWNQIYDYFKFINKFINYHNSRSILIPIPISISIENSLLRYWLDLILKIVKINNIPSKYELFLKSSFCKLIKFAYEIDKPPFDHLKFFSLLLSYISFNPSKTLKNSAFDALLEMFSWNENTIIELLQIKKDRDTFFEKLKTCIETYISASKAPLILKEIHLNILPNFENFNFNELIYQFYKFRNLDEIDQLRKLVLLYPKNLLNLLKKSKFQESLTNWPINSFYDDFLYFFEVKWYPTHYTQLKNNLTPKYPNLTEKETRLYLYTLSINKQKGKLNPLTDVLFTNVFEFNREKHPDIFNYSCNILETYKIPDSFIDIFINKICEGNSNLFHLMCQQVYNSLIYKSENKFKILEEAINKNDENLLFLFLCIQVRPDTKIVNETNNFKMFSNSSNIFTSVFTNIEKSYINWDTSDRLSFWCTISKLAIKQNFFSDALNSLDLFIKKIQNEQNYVYVDRRMVILLTKHEVEDLKDDEIDRLISEKVKFYNDKKLDIKNMKKITKEGSKKKTKSSDDNCEEISKTYDIGVESGETLHVFIKVYPNGKKGNDNENDMKKLENNSKKLTKNERKLLFLDEVQASTVKSSNNQSKIIKFADYIITPIINDIFKGVFKGNNCLGKFVGLSFESKLDFSLASDVEIKNELENFTINENKFTNFLFIKFVNYLQNRKIKSSILKKRLKLANDALKSNGY
jgi:hypothetical protein